MLAFGTVLLCVLCMVGVASAETAGTVNTLRFGDTAFDPYTSSSSPTTQAWIQTHMWRMTVYAPYFDSKTSWYKNGWLYKDAYALYTNEHVATEHPEWVLHSASGEKLYIPYGCSGGTCPQYAGNIADAGFRAWWIEQAKASLAHGYRGLFVDDVNMEFRVGNGDEQQVAPIDPATGQPMTSEAWRRYMAQFMVQIRTELPGVEIVHNAIWFADSPTRQSEPYIQQETSSANYVYLERGVNDSGLTGGSGEWSLSAFLSYAEEVNARGTGVVLGNEATNRQGESYDLASYFLISNGNDGIDVGDATPQNWWSGWEVQLGEGLNSRYTWSGLQRRDFTNGMVLVNGPGAATQTVHLASPMYNAEGELVSSVTLPAASGAILRSADPIVAPITASGSSPETPAIPGGSTTPSSPTGTGSTSPKSTSSKASSGSSSPTSSKSDSGSSKSTSPVSAPTSHHTATHTIVKASRIAGAAAESIKSAKTRAHAASSSSAAEQALIDGTVVNATAGSVVIQVQVLRAQHWTTVRRVTVGVSSQGTFARHLALAPRSRYRVRAVYQGADGCSPSRSGYRLLALDPL